MNLVEKARRRQDIMEKLLDDPEMKKHPQDLEVFACMVWFDYLSEKLEVSAKIKDFVIPLIRERSSKPPVFDADRVGGWFMKHFKVKPNMAAKRVAQRDTYHRTTRQTRYAKEEQDAQ